ARRRGAGRDPRRCRARGLGGCRRRARPLPSVARRRPAQGRLVHARSRRALRQVGSRLGERAQRGPLRVRPAARCEGAARTPDDGRRGTAAAPGARSALALTIVAPADTRTILISGGGPVGLTVAALLAASPAADRLRIEVVESG